MRTWLRSAVAFTCGGCGEQFPPGSPLQRLILPLLNHPKDRCATCATEPAPSILPAPVASTRSVTLTHIDDDGIERPGPSPAPMTPISQEITKLAARRAPGLDYKQKASGE